MLHATKYTVKKHLDYHNDPKVSDRKTWANSIDTDQTAQEKQSDLGLHCLPFCLHLFKFLESLQQFFGCPNI